MQIFLLVIIKCGLEDKACMHELLDCQTLGLKTTPFWSFWISHYMQLLSSDPQWKVPRKLRVCLRKIYMCHLAVVQVPFEFSWKFYVLFFNFSTRFCVNSLLYVILPWRHLLPSLDDKPNGTTRFTFRISEILNLMKLFFISYMPWEYYFSNPTVTIQML